MTEKIRRCKEYIEDLMGEPIPTYALGESCGHMNVLTVESIDAYHNIAQKLGISELIKKRNIYYKIQLPEDNSAWSIILSGENVWKFEDRYGTKYHITIARERPNEKLKENK